MISLMIVIVDMIIIISLMIVTVDMLDMRFGWWLWQLLVLSSIQLQKVSVTLLFHRFNALYYVLFCPFLSTCVQHSVLI